MNPKESLMQDITALFSKAPFALPSTRPFYQFLEETVVLPFLQIAKDERKSLWTELVEKVYDNFEVSLPESLKEVGDEDEESINMNTITHGQSSADDPSLESSSKEELVKPSKIMNNPISTKIAQTNINTPGKSSHKRDALKARKDGEYSTPTGLLPIKPNKRTTTPNNKVVISKSFKTPTRSLQTKNKATPLRPLSSSATRRQSSPLVDARGRFVGSHFNTKFASGGMLFREVKVVRRTSTGGSGVVVGAKKRMRDETLTSPKLNTTPQRTERPQQTLVSTNKPSLSTKAFGVQTSPLPFSKKQKQTHSNQGQQQSGNDGRKDSLFLSTPTNQRKNEKDKMRTPSQLCAASLAAQAALSLRKRR